MTRIEITDTTAAALRDTLTSRAEADSNVVDGLFAIASAIHHLADAVMSRGAPGHDSLAGAIRSTAGDIAEAIRDGRS